MSFIKSIDAVFTDTKQTTSKQGGENMETRLKRLTLIEQQTTIKQTLRELDARSQREFTRYQSVTAETTKGIRMATQALSEIKAALAKLE